MDSFFPKCFIISKSQGHASTPFENDIEQFNEEYRFVFSASILKKYINKAQQEFETWQHLIPKILVSLNICEKRLLTIDEQIDQFGECTGDLVSETEWKVLELTKRQMNQEKIKEINEKKWF